MPKSSDEATNPAWLEAALAYIPQWLGHQMRVSEEPGCAIAVAWHGRIVLEAAFGHADQPAGVALTSRHRFRVASHSKSFTAAGILKLREQGRLRLDDTAGQYVTGLHPDVATATLSQLLSHTAGIFRDGLDSGYWAMRKEFANDAELRADLALPPSIDANTRLKYSNHGFGLAGLVIEGITGEPYNVWTQREIVDAAGLRETTPDVPLPKAARLAKGHAGKLVLGAHVAFPSNQSTHALASATGFVSTAADLAKWFTNLSPDAETSILSRESRREITRPQWADPHSVLTRTYGLGTNSGKLEDWAWFGHGGGFPGVVTRTAMVPSQGLCVSVLTNVAEGSAPIWLDGALNILKRFQSEGAPTDKVADWAGRWWSIWGPTDLVPMGDKVLLALPGLANPFQKVGELEVIGADEARIAVASAFGSYNEPVRRLRNKAGKVVKLRVASGTAMPEAAIKKELQAYSV
jgi:CubicO group peptidase (beta-lactamase class C family)